MTEAAPGSVTVLVADPDPSQQQRVIDCLRPRFRVITATTLAETSQQIVQYRPSVLLLELDMPDGDGKQLIKQIRETPALRAMKICCVTRRSGVRDKVAGFQSGADDYVVKPINEKMFLWRVVLLTRLR
jgi:DNA-binding response OmpR family regulator